MLCKHEVVGSIPSGSTSRAEGLALRPLSLSAWRLGDSPDKNPGIDKEIAAPCGVRGVRATGLAMFDMVKRERMRMSAWGASPVGMCASLSCLTAREPCAFEASWSF